MIYEIRQDTMSGTYRVYKEGRPVVLTRSLTKSQKEFINSCIETKDNQFRVWRKKK